jgi:hypothetical protein
MFKKSGEQINIFINNSNIKFVNSGTYGITYFSENLDFEKTQINRQKILLKFIPICPFEQEFKTCNNKKIVTTFKKIRL